MKNPKRIPVMLDGIRTLWEMHPDLRFGQLLSNILHGEDLFTLDDEVLLAVIYSALASKVREQLSKASAVAAKESESCEEQAP